MDRSLLDEHARAVLSRTGFCAALGSHGMITGRREAWHLRVASPPRSQHKPLLYAHRDEKYTPGFTELRDVAANAVFHDLEGKFKLRGVVCSRQRRTVGYATRGKSSPTEIGSTYHATVDTFAVDCVECGVLPLAETREQMGRRISYASSTVQNVPAGSLRRGLQPN